MKGKDCTILRLLNCDLKNIDTVNRNHFKNIKFNDLIFKKVKYLQMKYTFTALYALNVA